MDSSAPSLPPKSDPPIVKIALVGQHTVVTLGCIFGVVILALRQNWPSDTTLVALGALSGLWAIGKMVDRRK